MGIAYKNLNKLDSAMLIVQNGLSLSKQFGYKQNVSRLLTYIGEIDFARGNIDTAGNTTMAHFNSPTRKIILFRWS